MAPPVVLMAVPQDSPMESVLLGMPHEVYHVRTGALALECAPSLRPDVIMLAVELPDMPGVEACRQLHQHPRLQHSVPILILSAEPPTPEQRVAALAAGAWDFVRYPDDLAELSLKVQAFVQAKRNIDVALAESGVENLTNVHSRAALARRARELGALMVRMHGALTALVFVLDTDTESRKLVGLLARAARTSDIVGEIREKEYALIAPDTDEAEAVQLARRVNAILQREGQVEGGAGLRVGYAAVTNSGYRPVDPVELLTQAVAAVRAGRPEPGCSWLRRYEDSTSNGPLEAAPLAAPRSAPSGKESA